MLINSNARKWIDALRSGIYKQGYRTLHNIHHQYCCLGVLCDLYAKENSDVTEQISPDNSKYVYVTHRHHAEHLHSGVLPQQVQKWVGLGSDFGIDMSGADSTKSLIQYNDIECWTFDEIANELEKHPERYFIEQ